ncbi:MAG TPA: RDD family protein [Solirubrobacteraceae bacterium]
MSITALRLRKRAPASAAAARDDVVDAAPSQQYVGLVTRAIAFALDAALINAIAILTTAVVTLTFSVVTVPQDVRTAAVAIGGAAYLLWSVGYFVVFWAATGQTPGSRALHIRVRAASGGRLPPRRALVRFVGLTLAALPLFAGFLLILIDDRRRGLHDVLARTVVVEAEDE